MNYNRSDNPLFQKFIAIVFAILLFAFVNYENSSRIQSTNPIDGASITGVEVVTDVPITIDINQDVYFVSGIPETATIRLEGPQAILTQTLATQNFDIVTPDLSEIGPGTHIIELEAEGLSNSLNYSIMPTEVEVTIEEKSSVTLSVNVEFNDSSLADGYEAGEPVLSQTEVQISGARSRVESVNEVTVIVMPDGTDFTEDIEMTLPILVFDSSGELLDVNVNPKQIDVTIPVNGTEKSVPIVLRETGTGEPDYAYSLELAQGQPENVTLTAMENILAEMNNFPVEIDISGVTESTIRTIPLEGTEDVEIITPSQIDVVIRANKETNDGEETDTSTEEELQEEIDDTNSNPTEGDTTETTDTE
ncbi:CdaR family protein [Lacticigenium naphthae]|uniref:CdaR family protein n=1 Tax=Lacticigenium naphthae TaxID=515351 RepID=UPI0003FEAFEA|nr:CdaR family protein [Lacticigenium naphthae]